VFCLAAILLLETSGQSGNLVNKKRPATYMEC